MAEAESLNTGGNSFFSAKAVEDAQVSQDPALESDEDLVAEDDNQDALEDEDALEASAEEDDLNEDDPKALKKALLETNEKLRDAEQKRRQTQSEKDLQQINFNSAMKGLNKRLQLVEQRPAQAQEDSLGLQDDDIMDYSSVKKLLAKQQETTDQGQEGIDDDELIAKEWVSRQPHVKEVSDYIQENNLAQDITIIQSPTNMAGMYNAAEVRMLREQNEGLEKENVKLKKEYSRIKKHGTKGKVPNTSTGNSTQGGNKGVGTRKGALENHFTKKFF